MIKMKHAASAVLLIAATAIATSSVSAAEFTFTTSGGNDSTTTAKTYTSNTVGGVALNMRVSAWHTTNPTSNAIASAALGLWSPGLGVLTSDDTGNQHQIDNINGVDFLMLQFDHVVQLSSISRVVFDLGFNPDHDDAAYWADTTAMVGTATNWSSAISLTPYSYAASSWIDILGDGTNGTTAVSNAPSAAVWLFGASPNDRNDGFKLSSLKVNYSAPAAVPEPASWAMMTIGFGALGAALRRRRPSRQAFAAIA